MKYDIMAKSMLIFIIFCLFCWGSSPAAAFSGLKVSVEIIKADQNSKIVDPELKDLVKELAPVLNYSGFSLIKKAVIQLRTKEKGRVILPSGPTLALEFLGFKDQQARLSVSILEKGKEIFRTILLLVNKGSILIGGPPYQGGVLLLRVGGEFR